MTYDRSKAVEYADKFWDRPCDDGVFWTSNESLNVARLRAAKHKPERDGWVVRFVPDRAGANKAEMAVFQKFDGAGAITDEVLIQGWAGLADCAHFLSLCITAGGVKISDTGVPSLLDKLQNMPIAETKTLAQRVDQTGGQRVIDSGLFKPGDMIGYFNIDPHGDYDGALQYSHSAMYAGKLPAAGDPGHVTCHTKSRFPGRRTVSKDFGTSDWTDAWFLDPGAYQYTFIHFSSDDPKPSEADATAFAGWWLVKYGGRTEYYYVLKDGRARYTVRAPKSANELSLAAADGSAFWFMELRKTSFVWRKTGTIDVWTPAADGSFTILVNGSTAGTATRLF